MTPRLQSGCLLLSLFAAEAAAAQNAPPSSAPDFPFPVTAAAPGSCKSYFAGSAADGNALKAPLSTDADNILSESDGTLLLKGNVHLSRGGMQIEAGQLRYNPERGEAQAEEKLRIRSPELLLDAEAGIVQPDSERAELTGVRYALPGTLIHGEAAAANLRDGSLRLEQATYSHCPPEREAWRVRARKLEIDTETGIARARSLYLELGGRRVMYLPYLRFSTDRRRRSGFLSPEMKYSSDDGLDLTLPLYFNLAPNYDFTLSPRYIEKRGTLLQGEFRHLSPRSSLYLEAAHMSRDRERPEENERFLYHLDYRGALGRQWRAEVDYAKVSDLHYLRDFGSDLHSSRQLRLLQRGRLYRAGKNWLIEAGLNNDQAAAADALEPYRRQPWLHLAYRGGGTPFRTQYLFEMQYADFEHSSSARTTGRRLYTETGAAFPMQWRGGDLRPWVLFRHLEQRTENGPEDSAGVFSAGFEGGLRFERHTPKGLFLQTLEPRLFYVRTRYEAQDRQPDFDSERLEFTPEQLFRRTRFASYDRIDDADRLSLALRTRLFSAESGREVLRASLGQIFHFRERRVRLGEEEDEDRENRVSNSPLAALLEYRPDPDRHLRLETVWDSRRGRLDGTLLNVRQLFAKKGHAQLRYRFDRIAPAKERREQVEASWLLRLEQGWSLFGNWHYDLDLGQNSQAEAGIERNTCCWGIRLALRRSLESDGTQDNIFLLQFKLPKT